MTIARVFSFFAFSISSKQILPNRFESTKTILPGKKKSGVQVAKNPYAQQITSSFSDSPNE